MHTLIITIQKKRFFFIGIKKQKYYKIILQKCYILRKEEENKCIDLIPEYKEFIKHIGEEGWEGTFTHKIKPLFLDKIIALQDKKIELMLSDVL